MKSSIEQKIQEAKGQDIDLTPLLDVVFILLIFFIVTTVFVKETGVDVDRPQAISSKSIQNSIILLANTQSHEVIYGGTNIGISGVRNTLSQLIKNEAKPLVIQADKSVPTDVLVRVIDQAKLAGIEKINIATLVAE